MISFYREAGDRAQEVRLTAVVRQMLDRLVDQEAGLLARVRDPLISAGLTVSAFTGGEPEPSMRAAIACYEQAKSFGPDVLVANATPSLAAMRQATRTIPIVFIGVADPVGQGFVPSLARPGGNMTGFGLEEPSMGAKWVELLKEISPRMARAAILFNPETAPFGRMFLPSMHAAAVSSVISLTIAPVSNTTGIEQAIVEAGREPVGGLIALPDAFLFGAREMIVLVRSARDDRCAGG